MKHACSAKPATINRPNVLEIQTFDRCDVTWRLWKINGKSKEDECKITDLI